ncbi:hypothetical protein Tco_0509204 [Tanacetum coccineum]
MSYYPKGHQYNPNDDEDVDDFDEHDPTPYSGGLTSGGSYDSGRSNYKSHGQQSASGGGSGYGRRNDDDQPDSGYGRRPEHGSEYGSGQGHRTLTGNMFRMYCSGQGPTY